MEDDEKFIWYKCKKGHEYYSEEFLPKDMICEKCGCIIEQKVGKSHTSRPKKPQPFMATCPYCGQTYSEKITTASKATGLFFFGALGLGKVSKQWHCKNCKSDF